MEGLALEQAKAVSELPFIQNVFAMPDLHAGKTPVGITAVSENIIYPHLIGTDIGCGMSVFGTQIEKKKIKQEKWVARLNTIKTLSAVPSGVFYPDCPIPDFGTLGSGNHFAEFQTVHTLYDKEGLCGLGMDEKETYITVHSGSRSYGSDIFSEYKNYNGYEINDARAKSYMAKHDDALIWSARNREEVAAKLIGYLGFYPFITKKLECNHNFLEICGEKAYHRKGSVSSKNGAVLIAGSRGSLSYIVKPTDKCNEFGYSLAHGAGRKWARSMCKSRIKDKYDSYTIKRNKYGGELVCHDLALTYEEAPEAYKSIDNIIDILKEYGLIELIATMTPVLTFKG